MFYIKITISKGLLVHLDTFTEISTNLLYRIFSVIQNTVLYDTEKVGINYEIKMLRITKKIRTLINFHSEGEENRK